MATNTVQLTNSLDLRFDTVFLASWDQFVGDMSRLQEIVRVEDSDRSEARFGEVVAGLNTAPVKSEGSPINYENMQQGKSVVHTFATYAVGFGITLEMRQDDEFGLINDFAVALSGLIGNTVHNDVYDVYNAAFTDTQTYSSTTLCATSHTLSGDVIQTGQNRPNTDVDLTETTLESLISLGLKTLGEDGQFVMWSPSRLIVATDNWATASKIVRSTTTTVSATGESGNAINAIALRHAITVHDSPFLTDADAWFIQSDRPPARLIWRMRPQISEFWVDDPTKNWNKDIITRWVVGIDTWRGVVGTSGA